MLSGILVTCNLYDLSRDNDEIKQHFIRTIGFTWPELALVQDYTMLNIIMITTICLGWMSLLLDVIIASIKKHYGGHNNDNSEDQDDEASFWDGAILLTGYKYRNDKTEN